MPGFVVWGKKQLRRMERFQGADRTPCTTYSLLLVTRSREWHPRLDTCGGFGNFMFYVNYELSTSAVKCNSKWFFYIMNNATCYLLTCTYPVWVNRDSFSKNFTWRTIYFVPSANRTPKFADYGSTYEFHATWGSRPRVYLPLYNEYVAGAYFTT